MSLKYWVQLSTEPLKYRKVIHTRVTGYIKAHVLKTFVIFVGYKVLYIPQENDILNQPSLEIILGYEILYFP